MIFSEVSSIGCEPPSPQSMRLFTVRNVKKAMGKGTGGHDLAEMRQFILHLCGYSAKLKLCRLGFCSSLVKKSLLIYVM